jgi:chemotaxis protein CheY-P-specific phosphatase CheC
MLPTPPESDATARPIVDAVGAVAQRSFYAFVDVCDESDDLDHAREWLVSTVHFDNGLVAGSLACSLPAELAQVLFDAFSGRDPATPLPPAHLIDDLVGEFSNMVCGDWLSRCHDERVFDLSPPRVSRMTHPAAHAGHRQWVKVNDRPLAVDWDMAGAAMRDGH